MIEIRKVESSQDWDRAVQVAPHATVFHRRVWLDLLASAHRMESFLGGVYDGHQLVGVFPVWTRERGPFRIAGSPQGFSGALTPYLGPAVPDQLLVPTLEAFERWQQERGIDYAEMTLDWEADRAIWSHFHYAHTCRHTVWLPLPTKEELVWKGMTKSCRGAVRKAESQGLEVVEISDRGFFDKYVDMAADVYAKTCRLPPVSAGFFQAMWDALHPARLLRVLAALRGQEVVAAAIFLLHREAGRAYYLDGVCYSRYRQLCANNLIQWIMLQELVRQNFVVYDMVGAEREGIRQFKLSFGGSLHPYDYAFKPRTPWARLARNAYRWLAPAGRFFKYHLGAGYKQHKGNTLDAILA